MEHFLNPNYYPCYIGSCWQWTSEDQRHKEWVAGSSVISLVWGRMSSQELHALLSSSNENLCSIPKVRRHWIIFFRKENNEGLWTVNFFQALTGLCYSFCWYRFGAIWTGLSPFISTTAQQLDLIELLSAADHLESPVGLKSFSFPQKFLFALNRCLSFYSQNLALLDFSHAFSY